ncbi:hypothetical protein [Pseudoduganella violaceinigra]|uniref:hypothetical protein n=1 Tax=Pseudoduganella violaceinigra TaxID=246602 RepID=UPI0004254C50|nr:hypothetical protein [Pseudoduganella violaceinigra]
MGADRIAEISTLIREVLESYASSPSDSDDELCATLEVDGHPEAWVQFVFGTLNFAYPAQQAPDAVLADVLDQLPGWRIESWEAEKYATVNFDHETSVARIANAIDALFTQLFSLDDFSIDGRLEEISCGSDDPSPPELIAIDHDDYHAAFVGTTADGRQFFLTTPFEPAVGGRDGEEFLALYLFDADGMLLDAKIDRCGSRATMDRSARQSLQQKRLADLGPVTYQRIEIAPFAVEKFGTTFGLVLRAPEDEDDVWAVEAQPGNYMAFFEPWDSGQYDT